MSRHNSVVPVLREIAFKAQTAREANLSQRHGHINKQKIAVIQYHELKNMK